jgi:hypothetical protein
MMPAEAEFDVLSVKVCTVSLEEEIVNGEVSPVAAAKEAAVALGEALSVPRLAY